MLKSSVNLIEGLIGSILKILYPGFRILIFLNFFGFSADFREHLLKNRRFFKYREIVKYFFRAFKNKINQKKQKMPVHPSHGVFAHICEENVRKIRNLWVYDVLSISKKLHFWPKSSILTLFCLPDRKIFAYKFSP